MPLIVDAEDRSNKIKVEIKPISSPNDRHTPDNVADIRNLVKTLRLSPPANVRAAIFLCLLPLIPVVIVIDFRKINDVFYF